MYTCTQGFMLLKLIGQWYMSGDGLIFHAGMRVSILYCAFTSIRLRFGKLGREPTCNETFEIGVEEKT